MFSISVNVIFMLAATTFDVCLLIPEHATEMQRTESLVIFEGNKVVVIMSAYSVLRT